MTSAVTNAFSQMHSMLERRKWAGWIVVLVPCYSALVMHFYPFSYFQLLFSTVWVFVLNQLVPLKANELEMLSVHSLSGSSPP